MQPEVIFTHWDQVRSGLIATIASFEADELGMAPFENAWTVGEITLHIANAEEGWIRYCLAQELPEWPQEYDPGDYPDRDSILKELERVHTYSLAHLTGLSDADLTAVFRAPWGEEFQPIEVVLHLIEHEVHHRGELSLILGSLGRDGYQV